MLGPEARWQAASAARQFLLCPPPPPRSLEHCCGVSNRGLLALAAGLPRLGELRLCGSGVGEGAVAQLRRTPRGRRLRIGLYKHCWWMAAEGDALAL